MGRKDKEANSHRTISLIQGRMITRKELFQRNKVSKTLAHLLSVDGNHIVMHPIVNHLVTLAGYSLCDLTLMMREYKIHATAVNIKMTAEVFTSHSCTLAVPPRISLAPRTWPAHNMLGSSFLPESKVHLVLLLANSIQFPAIIDHVGKIAMRKNPIFMVLVILFYIEINGTIADIGIPVVKDLLHQLFLFYDMACSMRFNRRRQYIKGFHGIMIAVGIVLGYFHRLKLFQTSFLLYFIITFICIVLQVTDIRNITHIAYLIPKMSEIPEYNIKSYCGTGMPEMRISIYGRTAYIHTYIWCVQGFKQLLTP